jgi:hypothetical protein
VTPFWLPEIIAVVAAVFFVLRDGPRPFWKGVVIVTVCTAFVLQHLVHGSVAWTLGLVLYVAIAVSMLVYLKAGS